MTWSSDHLSNRLPSATMGTWQYELRGYGSSPVMERVARMLGHEPQPNRKQLSLCHCIALAFEDVLCGACPNLILRQTGADVPIEVWPALDMANVQLFREGCLHHRAGMQFVLVLMVQTPTGQRRKISVRLDSTARIQPRGLESLLDVIVPTDGRLVWRLEIEVIDDQKSPFG